MAKTAAPVLPSLQQAFHDTKTSMDSRLVERSTITQTALIALASKTHVFYLGTPGTAKSLTVRTLVKHISGMQDGDSYEKLLTPFSTDSSVFGGLDLLALEQGTQRKKIEGKLATARIAFLDEIFKANDSVLQALLTALNERVFHNEDDGTIEMPLWTMFGASNELPQSVELEAMYDRLHFRHIIKRINERGNFVRMLKSRSAGPVVPTLSLDQINEAHLQVDAVELSNEVYEALADLRHTLKADGIEPTDRRMSDCLPVIQATAWWRGAAVAEVDDMRLIRHMLWTRPDEIPVVDTHVLQLASPLEAEANTKRAEIEELAEQFDKILKDADNDQQKNKKAIELHTKLDKVAKEIEDLEARVTSGGRSSDVVQELKDRVLAMADTLLDRVFNIPAELRR